MNKLLQTITLFKDWPSVILDRANLINLKSVELRNNLKFNLLGKGSISCIQETIGRKRYTLFKDIKPNDVVVDIGAYIGDFSIYAGHKGATVYAYEPTEESFNILNQNAELNRLNGSINSFNKGVYSFQTRMQMNQHKLQEINSLRDSEVINTQSEKTGTKEIELTTIEQIFKDNNLSHIDFLKIDTEGSEADIILSTPTETMKKIRYIAMESTDYEKTNKTNIRLLNFLVDCGFKVEIISSNNTINILKIYAEKEQ